MVQRTVDELGRIVLPIEIRNAMGIHPSSALAITLTDGKIVMQNVFPCCKLCGSSENIVQTECTTICSNCIRKIKDL